MSKKCLHRNIWRHYGLRALGFEGFESLRACELKVLRALGFETLRALGFDGLRACEFECLRV